MVSCTVVTMVVLRLSLRLLVPADIQVGGDGGAEAIEGVDDGGLLQPVSDSLNCLLLFRRLWPVLETGQIVGRRYQQQFELFPVDGDLQLCVPVLMGGRVWLGQRRTGSKPKCQYYWKGCEASEFHGAPFARIDML